VNVFGLLLLFLVLWLVDKALDAGMRRLASTKPAVKTDAPGRLRMMPRPPDAPKR
jgi:hypothetical protein